MRNRGHVFFSTVVFIVGGLLASYAALDGYVGITVVVAVCVAALIFLSGVVAGGGVVESTADRLHNHEIYTVLGEVPVGDKHIVILRRRSGSIYAIQSPEVPPSPFQVKRGERQITCTQYPDGKRVVALPRQDT